VTTPPGQPVPVGSQCILVAEDSPLLQRIVQMQLQKLGYAVQLAGSGKEAVEAASSGKYSAILMDWQMPDMDGLEATRLIREAEQGKDRHVPIIALTAHAMQADRESCIAAGMDDYLSKPFSRDQLDKMLRKWAEQP
jgi:two-component system, sensor histidine kinase